MATSQFGRMTCLQVAGALPPAQAVPTTADISAIASTAVTVASAMLHTSASNLITIMLRKKQSKSASSSSSSAFLSWDLVQW